MEGGQCPCQEGQKGAKNVVGRRCNQCEDKQGQIVSGRGCVGECVIYQLHLGCHGVTQNLLFKVPPAIWERCCVTPMTKVYPVSHMRVKANELILCCVFNLVINTSCPRAFAEEIWWEKAAFGKTAEEKCPFGSSGL